MSQGIASRDDLAELVDPLVSLTRGERAWFERMPPHELRDWANALLRVIEQGGFFTDVVSSSLDAILTRDLEGRITSWNAAAESLFGYTVAEVKGRHVRMLAPPDRYAEVDASIARSRSGLTVDWFDTLRQRKDGSLVPVALTASPIYAMDGTQIGISTILRDRSTQRQAEERFRLAVEASPNGMIMVDADGEIVLVNSEIEHMFGYARNELLGKPVDVLVPARFRGGHAALRANYAAAPQARHMGAGRDLYGLRKDGTEFAIEIGLNPLQQADGLAVLASVVDITERQRAEERFRLAVEASPNGMIMTNADGEIVLVNSEIERMFDYSRDELLGASIDMLVPGRFRSGHAALRSQYAVAPEARRMGEGRDLYGRRKDGTEIAIEIGLNPLRQHDGVMVLASVVDIRERKAAQDALESRTRELERSNADLEQFAYAASHDLQEPLRMVASYTELLARRYRGALDERADRYIGYATEGARRMQNLIEDLLAFSRAGAGSPPAEAASADEALDAALSVLRIVIRETGTTIEREPLPRIFIVQSQLVQVFQNLIGNAIKFRAEGRSPVIRITAGRHGGWWEISVADNGIGIDEQYAGRVFQMFQRLHERAEYEGTGIGLAITKKVVESVGGRIWFESEPGVGTTFRFTMPADLHGSDADEHG